VRYITVTRKSKALERSDTLVRLSLKLTTETTCVKYGTHTVPPVYSKISLTIFANRNHARFRQIWTEQAKHLGENLSLSGGMRAFLNKHPVESVYGKLESGEFSRAVVDLVAGTYGNTSKIDLKVDDLMSLPSIAKENYATVYMIITQNRNGNFVYFGSTSCWKERKFCWQRKSHGMMAKEIAFEDAITSFKLLMSLYLPPASKYLEERTNWKASLLVCESVLIGLFGTRPGGAYSNCPFVTHYKGGNLQWPLHDGGWVKEANWLKREGQALQALHDYWVASRDPLPRSWREFWILGVGIEDEETRLDRCKSRRTDLKRRANAGTEGERRALGFPTPTEDQIEARRMKDRQYRASWTQSTRLWSISGSVRRGHL
jgi:hypothetical protein